jgi:hypothetical protein
MTSYSNREQLIAALTDDLAPVRRVRPVDGVMLVGFATLITAMATIALFRLPERVLTGEAAAYFWIINGLLLLLGAASTSALVASALPRVGQRSSAPFWGAAMLGVVPLAAVISLTSLGMRAEDGGPVMWMWDCAARGVTAGLLVATAAVMFLRRGAPVAHERAGWLVGLATGSLGSLAYGITCPLDTLSHVGIVHVAPVLISAIVARLIVPPLIRW